MYGCFSHSAIPSQRQLSGQSYNKEKERKKLKEEKGVDTA
jgi:hypothetical protein